MERTLCAIATIALVMCAAMTIALAYIGYNYQRHFDSPVSSSRDPLSSPTADRLVKINRINDRHRLNNAKVGPDSLAPVVDEIVPSGGGGSNSLPNSLPDSSVSNQPDQDVADLDAGRSTELPTSVTTILNNVDLENSDAESTGENAQGSGQRASSDSVCLTPECVKAAAELIKNMDESVQPCEDFYRFACGGWVDNQVIPEDRTSVSVFSLLQDDLNNKLRVLVERKPEEPELEIYTKMRNMYSSCMNLTQIESVGNSPLLETLDQLGGWPVLLGNSWNGSSFDWLATLIKFRQLGFSHDLLMDLSVTPDFRNNTHHVIDVSPSVDRSSSAD